jgi:hypothetical protein
MPKSAIAISSQKSCAGRVKACAKRSAVLEEGLAGEVLEVRVLHPTGKHRLVGKAVGVLEIHQPRHQTRMDGRPPLTSGEEAGPLPLEPVPVDQCRQPDQLVPPIDHVDQPRPQQVRLLSRAGTMLHARQNRRVSRRKQSNPANPGRSIRQFSQPDQWTASCSEPTSYFVAAGYDAA